MLPQVPHELREAHRRSIIIGRRSATGRIAMFLSMLETNNAPDATVDLIALPMSRSDIANYVGLSPEAMSRATGQLTKQGILKFDGPHAVRVIDRHRFRGLAADIGRREAVRSRRRPCEGRARQYPGGQPRLGAGACRLKQSQEK